MSDGRQHDPRRSAVKVLTDSKDFWSRLLSCTAKVEAWAPALALASLLASGIVFASIVTDFWGALTLPLLPSLSDRNELTVLSLAVLLIAIYTWIAAGIHRGEHANQEATVEAGEHRDVAAPDQSPSEKQDRGSAEELRLALSSSRALESLENKTKFVSRQTTDLARDPDHRNEAAFYVYRHLASIADLTSEICRGEVGAQCAVTIKYLRARPVHGGAFSIEPVISTLVRDSTSLIERQTYGPRDGFSYRDNTAFETLIEAQSAGDRSHFAARDLLGLAAHRKYKNSNPLWPSFYNSVAVHVISEPEAPEISPVGFVCVDSQLGDLTKPTLGPILENIARQVYDGLSLLFIIADMSLNGETHDARTRRLGWMRRNGQLVPRDEGAQMLFHSHLSRLASTDWLIRQDLREKILGRRTPQDGRFGEPSDPTTPARISEIGGGQLPSKEPDYRALFIGARDTDREEHPSAIELLKYGVNPAALPAAHRAFITKHLAICSDCAKSVARLRAGEARRRRIVS